MADELKPTPRQHRELRRLAERTGTSFAVPRTFWEASDEITRMRALRPSSRVERHMERRDIRHALGAGTLASAPRDDEIAGYGSSARWVNRPST